MFERIRNSWELIKASAAVLRADKELIVFPIVSTIGVLVVMASFAVPMLLAGFFDALLAGKSQVFGFVVGFAFYIVQYFVIIFANSALVGAAMIRLRGGDPTVGDGFRIAMQHVVSILGYALISATVGMILRWLSERGKTLGRIVSSILGLAWNLATYLVVPVLVVEGVGPLEAIKRSANLLKKTWGEQIVGNFSIGLVFGLVIVLVIIVSVPIFVLVASTGSAAIIVPAALVFVLVLVFLGLINSTLNGIYIAAVYRYAAEGEASGFFSEEMVREAFRLK
jgi:ABC-type multidrug transport system fused ATPase/permease subunit